ncbi:MAG TPA: MarR family transcriptional regulator [Candidatus Dormibacteraeota bacterium]|nr:MarR family transcriptional regulator [Candidatus Dormibacteraeota bacterium]
MTLIQNPVDRAQLAGRLRLAVTRLNRRLRQQGESGLSATAFSALATISRLGPIALGELAAVEGVKPPSITNTVAGLEAQGMVVREADASDRRVTRVSVTPRGRLRLLRSRTRKTAYLAARLEALDEGELRVLAAAAGILERVLEHAP